MKDLFKKNKVFPCEKRQIGLNVFLCFWASHKECLGLFFLLRQSLLRRFCSLLPNGDLFLPHGNGFFGLLRRDDFPMFRRLKESSRYFRLFVRQP